MRLISHPVLCNYYVTYRCNATCGFCDIWERPSPYVDLETAKVNFAALKKLGVRVIDFTGGEPLLHRDLPAMLEIAKEMGFLTTVTTNALLYPKRAATLAGHIDMLHFSLDYDNAAQHDEARGVACFDKVMESIEVAKNLGERPDILFTVFDENVDQIENVYNHICRPNDLVLILNPVFAYNEVGAGLSTQSLGKLDRWAKKKGVYLNEAFLALRRDGGNDTTNPVCRAGSSTLVISPQNELVVPCYHLGTKAFPIEGELEACYNSEEVQKLIALEGKLPDCEGCAINCYMQPSFAVEMNKYWWKALPSTLKYNRMKGTWKQMF